MTGTINCIYEAPCGWCSKWDKKCNRKIEESKNTETDKKSKNNECTHKWMPIYSIIQNDGRIEYNYYCNKCREYMGTYEKIQ
jgi:hypothetical protein